MDLICSLICSRAGWADKIDGDLLIHLRGATPENLVWKRDRLQTCCFREPSSSNRRAGADRHSRSGAILFPVRQR